MYGYILSQNSNVRVTGCARTSFDSIKDGITIKSDKFGVIEGWKPYRLFRQAHEANDRCYDYIVCLSLVSDNLVKIRRRRRKANLGLVGNRSVVSNLYRIYYLVLLFLHLF